MPSLPAISGRDIVKAFAKDGWQMVRQRGGAPAWQPHDLGQAAPYGDIIRPGPP